MKTKIQNLKGLKSRSEQLSTEKTPENPLIPIDFERRRANRRLSKDRLLALLRSEAPRFFELAEVVGKWVWIQFAEKQPREVTAHFGRAWLSLERRPPVVAASVRHDSGQICNV